MTNPSDSSHPKPCTSTLIKGRAEYVWLSFLLILAFLLLPILRLIKSERLMIQEKGQKEQPEKGLHYYNLDDLLIAF
jgi:hypothetical protein